MALLTKEERSYEEMVELVRKPVQRFSNTQVGSELLGKFSTLLYSPTGYKSVDLIRSAWK